MIGNGDTVNIAGGRPAAEPGLTARLKEATKSLHTQAERSGVIAGMLRGEISRSSYALLLRNLLPVYEAMELGLERHRGSPAIGRISRPAIYRARALEADLARIAGPDWRTDLALLSSAERYADHVEMASREDGALLLAHAYVRYLGDLNGGQVLKRLLGRSLGLDEASLSFYDFPEIPDLDAFKPEFRTELDVAGRLSGCETAIVDEACVAFDLNIALSVEIERYSAGSA